MNFAYVYADGNFSKALYDAEIALMTPQQWRMEFHGPRWLESEFREAKAQSDGTCTGMLYGGDRSLDPKREADAIRFANMPIEEFVCYFGGQWLALSFVCQCGLPALKETVDFYLKRKRSPLPPHYFDGYVQSGNRLVKWHVT